MFNMNPHQRGNSIYNICAPKMSVYGSCPGRFTDGYFKQFSTNMVGNPVMMQKDTNGLTPNKTILDSVQGIFMNVLKISPNQQNQMNLKPKEFNFGYQGKGGPPSPTSPIKIDPKQAGKSFWPRPQTPTKSPVDISTFTVISPVSSYLDLEYNNHNNNSSNNQGVDHTNTSTVHEQEPQATKSAPTLTNHIENHMQTITETEEEDKELKEEEQQTKTTELGKMEQELLAMKQQSKLIAEARRLKQINKAKHRFNPLRVNNKDPIKNIREKWRRNIERDILEDFIEESPCNSSLESLEVEQVHTTDNIARSQAVPIPNAQRRHREFSPEDFPAISSSPLSKSAPATVKNHTTATQSNSLSDLEDDEYIVLDTDAPKSTPTHSPRKSMKICERFNRLFHNHHSQSPGTSPGVSMIPIPHRQRSASICSEDSFVVFFDPDMAEEAMNDLTDFDESDEETESESDSDSECELPPTSDEEDDDDENNNSHGKILDTTEEEEFFKVTDQVDCSTERASKKKVSY